jgi:hypothetical protein
MITQATPLFSLLANLAAWLGVAAPQAGEAPTVRRVIVRDEVLIHVPIGHRAPLFEWTERKGPKCLPAVAIAGASLAGPSAIDFVLRDRRRVRARLDSDCDGLDFYGGFYVEPRGREICAKRDEIRSRVGASCRIERFRALVPNFKRRVFAASDRK